MIILEQHEGVHVLRDDLLEGGTKSRFLADLVDPAAPGYVYATPAYGGFQIALASTAKRLGKEAHVFVAKRNLMHENTRTAWHLGAKITEVPYGYLKTVQARAREHAQKYGLQYLEWGADYPQAVAAIASTMREITAALGREPDEVWCTVGSGVLMRGILAGTDTAHVQGVAVGKKFTGYLPQRARVHPYPRPFQEESRHACPFPSAANYDRKAWEYCTQRHGAGTIVFWNVLG